MFNVRLRWHPIWKYYGKCRYCGVSHSQMSSMQLSLFECIDRTQPPSLYRIATICDVSVWISSLSCILFHNINKSFIVILRPISSLLHMKVHMNPKLFAVWTVNSQSHHFCLHFIFIVCWVFNFFIFLLLKNLWWQTIWPTAMIVRSK